MAEEPATSTSTRVRRRASRAAGPAKAEAAQSATVQVETAPTRPAQSTAKALKSVKPPPRRQPNRALVAWISFAAALLAIAALAGCLAVLVVQQRHANAQQARDQRFSTRPRRRWSTCSATSRTTSTKA